jgi:hypothetical protein
MSALPPKADIDEVEEHVRVVPKADIAQPLAEQGFGWGKNDMLTFEALLSGVLLSASIGIRGEAGCSASYF